MVYRLLKDSADIVAKPLTSIINTSLLTGIVPDEWKGAKVTPLHKKGAKSNLDNYRPISVLPAASKLLERAVHSQLYSFLTKNKLLSPYQCGFRKCHSTQFTALSDSVRRAMDQGLLTGAVFIDLQKAFDTVNHQILLNKLEQFGISNMELSWFKSYLQDRYQVVHIENELSEPCLLSPGVPQGSILGPLLFVLLMNDLPGVLTTCSTLLYADDTVIFYSGKDLLDIQLTLERNLTQVNSWLKDNSLFLHKDKTQSMLFGTEPRLRSADSFTVNFNGENIERVSEYKYLGLVMDETLSWNSHVKYTINKA